MSEPTTLSTEQQASLEAFVGELQADYDATTKSAGHYINSLVSGTYTVGPSGAQIHGWITYTESGETVRYDSVEISDYWGLAAMVTASPLVGVLEPNAIDGKVGRFKIHGNGPAATLQAWVDGQPVFKSPVPFGGTAIFGHCAEGEMRFRRG
ncbi:MAG: hypothetical protein AAGE94_24830 [Acidobacteriota bacterium]